MTNVFKIRHGKETRVYRTETAAEKKALLLQFRQVAEALAAKRRKEREGEHERRRTLWNGDGKDSAREHAVPEWMKDLADRAGEDPGDKAKADMDAGWIVDFTDEMTVAIALRRWDVATGLYEQGRFLVRLAQSAENEK